MNQQITKSTVINFLSGQATSLQKKLVEEWLEEEKNYELFYEWLDEWEREHPQFLTDTDTALQQYVEKIGNSKPEYFNELIEVKQKSNKTNWFRYAAATFILLSAAYLLNKADFIQYQTYSTGYGEVKQLLLEDGSRVFLNSNSSLQVPRFGFGKTTREVLIKGEAEFSVVHTKNDQKFLVHTTDNLEIEVVGTEFVVYSRARGSKVVLNKGKVVLRTLMGKDTLPHTLTIKPGDVVTIEKGKFNLKEKQQVKAHSAWKEHRFVFDHTSLREIAFEMEESFGVSMQIQDSTLANRQLTGTFEAQDADELIQVLARVLDVQVSQRGKKVTLSTQ